MEKTNVTIDTIAYDLEDLDTEYRDALSKCLLKFKYLTKTPFELSNGSDEEQEELKEVYKKDLRPYQIREIINYISNEMKDDYQYKKFESMMNKYLKIAEEQQKKHKPKCALIGKDANIFNLMGIASRTLKHNGMREESEEMIKRIQNSNNYFKALAIIDEYVDITDNEHEEDEDYENDYDNEFEDEEEWG